MIVGALEFSRLNASTLTSRRWPLPNEKILRRAQIHQRDRRTPLLPEGLKAQCHRRLLSKRSASIRIRCSEDVRPLTLHADLALQERGKLHVPRQTITAAEVRRPGPVTRRRCSGRYSGCPGTGSGDPMMFGHPERSHAKPSPGASLRDRKFDRLIPIDERAVLPLIGDKRGSAICRDVVPDRDRPAIVTRCSARRPGPGRGA